MMILRTSVCHCFACQQRTGTIFGAQIRLDKTKTIINGISTLYQRQGDSGNVINYHFCPTCGSTVYWEIPSMPECIIAAVGCFTNPMLPSPVMMVYGNRKHHWVQMPDTAIEYFDDDDNNNDDNNNNDNDNNNDNNDVVK